MRLRLTRVSSDKSGMSASDFLPCQGDVVNVIDLEKFLTKGQVAKMNKVGDQTEHESCKWSEPEDPFGFAARADTVPRSCTMLLYSRCCSIPRSCTI